MENIRKYNFDGVVEWYDDDREETEEERKERLIKKRKKEIKINYWEGWMKGIA
jgi:hypothetical protein